MVFKYRFRLNANRFRSFSCFNANRAVQSADKHLYMLSAIPEVLVDPIVEMLQAADLELQLLELGSHSQVRNAAAELVTLVHSRLIWCWNFCLIAAI